MDVGLAVEAYVTAMVESVTGMKVLLLDEETVQIVSLVYSQSEILQKEVYLVEKIGMQNRDKMLHLKAVVFVRPTPENVRMLVSELGDPLYQEYNLFFSNVLRDSQLQQLANADQCEVVEKVQEIFADFWAMDATLFSLNMPIFDPGHSASLERVVDGVFASVLALKKNVQIRYAAASPRAEAVATDVANRMAAEYDSLFRKLPATDTPPILLILDRIGDPVTPLLTQWTYQAMLHELIGITNNRVDLSYKEGIRKNLQEVVCSSRQDPFFRDAMFQNLGELGESLQELVTRFKTRTHTTRNVQTLDDIKRFVAEYPEFKRMAGSVEKHVALLDELSAIQNSRALMEVSEVEQEMVCNDGHSDIVRAIEGLLDNEEVDNEAALRLVLLYALRYESRSSNSLSDFVGALENRGADTRMVRTILAFAGASQRGNDLFANRGLIKSLSRRAKRGLSDVENVFTQHTPYLATTLENLVKGKLREADYPFASGSARRERPREIIVFMVGGATYEESLNVAQLNASNSGVTVVLGGTTVHNAASFMDEVRALAGSAGGSSAGSTSTPGRRR